VDPVPRLALIPPSKANPELRAAYESLRESMGVRGGMPLAPQIMQCLSHRPNLMLAAADGYRFAGWGGRLPRAQRELVALAVSRENDCFY
jgi:alkylhydroperoxidase family enzyme